MKRQNGIHAVNDDEWYTTLETARALAAWLARHLSKDTPILCPADLLPDGRESEIPKALRAAGFVKVRVTRNLPLIWQVGRPELDWERNEVIVTNPPFSLLVPFRRFVLRTGARYCVLARPGAMRYCWPIPDLADRFKAHNGRWVTAAWMQNIHDTSQPFGESIGNCLNCERKACPQNAMTGHLKAGEDRQLYGWGTAVKNGSAGWYCKSYTVDGKISFSRFFHPASANQAPRNQMRLFGR